MTTAKFSSSGLLVHGDSEKGGKHLAYQLDFSRQTQAYDTLAKAQENQSTFSI